MTKQEKNGVLHFRQELVKCIRDSYVYNKDLDKYLPNELDCLNAVHDSLCYVLRLCDTWLGTRPSFGEYDDLGVNPYISLPYGTSSYLQ